ncbi:MAG: PEGA domain-containing protein [Planctomycetota bacterium]|jgi:hypothetical protein
MRNIIILFSKNAALACGAVVLLLALSGCVERKLTINTEPEGALVTLNDEEIGLSPVTVEFNWYGDYKVRISKEGYETLDTHRKLKGPLYDFVGLDFIAEILWPGRIVDEYEWEFALEPYQAPSRAELLESAQRFSERAAAALEESRRQWTEAQEGRDGPDK